MRKIMAFKDDHFFLSNMYPTTIRFYDMDFKCSESAYQAFKCQNPTRMLDFLLINGYNAKKLGDIVEVRSDWEDIKLLVMREVIYAKFSQNEYIKTMLLSTGDALLIEGNEWRDTFWGVYDGEGENHLGRILMDVREELKGIDEE